MDLPGPSAAREPPSMKDLSQYTEDCISEVRSFVQQFHHQRSNRLNTCLQDVMKCTKMLVEMKRRTLVDRLVYYKNMEEIWNDLEDHEGFAFRLAIHQELRELYQNYKALCDAEDATYLITKRICMETLARLLNITSHAGQTRFCETCCWVRHDADAASSEASWDNHLNSDEHAANATLHE